VSEWERSGDKWECVHSFHLLIPENWNRARINLYQGGLNHIEIKQLPFGLCKKKENKKKNSADLSPTGRSLPWETSSPA
jgi:hypothetical protein